MIGPIPPLRHRAVVERNVVGGVSGTGQPLPPVYAVLHPALPCHYWEAEGVGIVAAGLIEGPRAVVVSEGPRVLIHRTADVKIGDRVTRVYIGDTVISDRPSRVVKDLWRQTHRELALQVVSDRSAQPVIPAEGS